MAIKSIVNPSCAVCARLSTHFGYLSANGTGFFRAIRQVMAPNGTQFRQTTFPVATGWGGVLLLLVIIVNLFTIVVAENYSMSVPAEFERYLTLPGQTNHFLRPNAIYFDQRFGEVYVTDPGHNRIAIFDKSGSFKFEFAGGEHFSTPAGLAIDNQGRIFVLGTTTHGRQIFAFDFDGMFLQELSVTDKNGRPLHFSSLAVDNNTDFYGLDESSAQIYVFDDMGSVERSFPVFQNNENIENDEQVFGAISVKGDFLYVPMASMGTVYVYDLNGRFVRTIGYNGNNMGELNFPIAVAITGDNLIMVLDKHRFNVVCFDSNGTFMGEFGGKGSSPGWFYHPTSIAANDGNSVFIGQIYMNRVQMCRIPEFISGAAKGATSGEVSLQPNMNKPELDDNHHLTLNEEVPQTEHFQISNEKNSFGMKRNEDYDH
jgi:DNA-binding beta-propeller fold protein YncE